MDSQTDTHGSGSTGAPGDGFTVAEPERHDEIQGFVNPYVFVVGCQRSGTTLLQRMLDAHPLLAVAYDSLFIPRPLRGERDWIDPPLSDAVIESVRTHPRFPRLELEDDAIERAADTANTYSAFVSALYDEYARAARKPLAGEKSPGYCRHIPRLHALFPATRWIHLIRDGRDVALSIRDWGKGAAKLELWSREPVAAAALWWRRDVESGTEAGRRLDSERYMECRYERLVSDPEAELRRMSEFLAIPFAPEMLRYHEGRAKSAPGLSPKAAWLPPTAGVRDWRTQLSARDTALFEAIAGDQLVMLGYEASGHPVDSEVAHAAGVAESWWRVNMG